MPEPSAAQGRDSNAAESWRIERARLANTNVAHPDRSAAHTSGHRTLLSFGPLFVFTDDGYEPGERVLFFTLRLPRLRRG